MPPTTKTPAVSAAPAKPDPVADLAVWAAMDLLDCGWKMADIATALERSIDWLETEITKAAEAKSCRAPKH